MKKRLLALDIGMVCLDLHPQRALASIGRTSYEELPVELLAAVERLECGGIEPDEFFSSAASILHLPDNAPVDDWFNLIIGGEMAGMKDAVAAIAPEWDFVFLSDISRPHLDIVRERVSFFGRARGGVYSFEVGRRKPDAAMYREFERRFGRPDLYVDDREQNIAAALERDWNAVRFIDAGQFSAIFDNLR
ncbi:MAG: hypothetical protein PHI85_10945 [Victivallaceae bacterium]|nr:hypothetical protein [Victivallaceae bacterium]